MADCRFEKFALQRRPTRCRTDRGAGAPAYRVELTRFGARIRMAQPDSDSTAAGHPRMVQAPLL